MSDKLTSEQITDIVKKLVGQTSWWGETNKDHESFENLKIYGDVIYQLVCDLVDKYMSSKDRYEGSVKSLNSRYALWLEAISDAIQDSIEEIKRRAEDENIKNKIHQ